MNPSAKSTLYATRWAIFALGFVTTIYFTVKFLTSNEVLLAAWNSAGSRLEASWLIHWFFLPVLVGVVVAPYRKLVLRVFYVGVFTMVGGLAVNMAPLFDNANTAFSFKFAALEHTPEHFFIDELEQDVQDGRFDAIPENARHIWFQKLSNKNMLELRIFTQLLNSEAPSVQYAQQWLDSGYVPSAIYAEIMSRLANDSIAFKETNFTTEQVAALLNN